MYYTYKGTAKASCSLYLWNHDEKIVVSDFDGTITRLIMIYHSPTLTVYSCILVHGQV